MPGTGETGKPLRDCRYVVFGIARKHLDVPYSDAGAGIFTRGRSQRLPAYADASIYPAECV